VENCPTTAHKHEAAPAKGGSNKAVLMLYNLSSWVLFERRLGKAFSFSVRAPVTLSVTAHHS